ncbi:YncE family protein [Natronosporangium hydrolyticum]|uniref:YncE family protein n=1 Tax=Natronosporangium hydrolyticum TaxID=2811111 RepID=A0A895YA73_9ACTN|nr:YncE family protein [Natronosporangium hydrolyticum]QSB14647.1 YncE family protein [Natronosporangium hydrolyticum]
MRTQLKRLAAAGSAGALLAAAGCGGNDPVDLRAYELLPGMPEYLTSDNVYGGAGPEMFAEHVRDHPAVVYAASYRDDEVYIIDQATGEVVDIVPGGPGPRYIVPGYDLSTLYVAASDPTDSGLVVIDPANNSPADFVDLPEISNLYFAPDGTYAIAVAETAGGLDFYHPNSWQHAGSLDLPGCHGASHLDYSADGRTMLVSCAGAGKVVALATDSLDQLAEFDFTEQDASSPQDVRLTPDGQYFLVADAGAGGVQLLAGDASTVSGFVATGEGAHAIYFSRDAQHAYVVNRDEANVTVLDLGSFSAVAEWPVPTSTLDLGGVNADGTLLWLAGGDDEVYAIDTDSGELRTRTTVGPGTYSVTVWPQPGRYSLGHTGSLR